MHCTGVSAHWCPIHGDCTCRAPEERMSDEDCPLHSPLSDHAEEQGIDTTWGFVEYET